MWHLYQFPLCPFSRKVRFLMAEKGVVYELVRESPWDARDEFLDLNPAGMTPVLVADDPVRRVAPAALVRGQGAADGAGPLGAPVSGSLLVHGSDGSRRPGQWNTF
jgi:hypothetical protein